MQPKKHRPIELNHTPDSDAVLQLLGQYMTNSTYSLVANLPFGSLEILCDSTAAFDVFADTFSHYLHNKPKVHKRYTLSVTAIEEAQWLPLKNNLTINHSSNGADIFTWLGGKGVIIDGSFAIFAPHAPAADFFILASNRPFMGNFPKSTKFAFHSDNPDYYADWPVVSDLIKGMYAFKSNVYCLHSALLERNGKGVLLVGDSGSGKTTASLTLARAGFTFLTDDFLFLNLKNESQLHATGLLMSPNFVGQSPTNLRELESTLEQGKVDKSSAKLDTFQIISTINEAVRPSLILLLENPGQRTNTHQLSQVEGQTALSSLMNQIVDPFTALRRIEHLNLANHLIEQCTVKRLVTGRNLKDLASLVDAELE